MHFVWYSLKLTLVLLIWYVSIISNQQFNKLPYCFSLFLFLLGFLNFKNSAFDFACISLKRFLFDNFNFSNLEKHGLAHNKYIRCVRTHPSKSIYDYKKLKRLLETYFLNQQKNKSVNS